MKYNNISNRGCPSVLIRVEDFLVEYKEDNCIDKLANLIKGREERATLNQDLITILYHVYMTTDLSITLVMDIKNKNNKALLKKLMGVPHKEIFYIEKPVQIASLLNTKRFLYYVDNNLERVSLINHSRCITLFQFSVLTRGGYTYV